MRITDPIYRLRAFRIASQAVNAPVQNAFTVGEFVCTIDLVK